MAKTINEARNTFLSDVVNLDANETTTARQSRNWLFTQIASFQTDDAFPKSWSEIDLHYGSFARRTKIRPLDDIDLIIGLHGQGSNYTEYSDRIEINANSSSNLLPLCNAGTYVLNSTKVINKFLSKCAEIPQYSSAELKKNGSAAVLSLKSHDWCFDIVPGFRTVTDLNNRTYYLIPDGSGNWKKTDPRIDQTRITNLNVTHNGHVLNAVRLVKYWNRRPTMPSIASYSIECLILAYCEKLDNDKPLTKYTGANLARIWMYIANAIFRELPDPKGLEKDLLSHLTDDDRNKIKEKADADYENMLDAIQFEIESKHEAAINKWREIFGDDFPKYG